MEKAAIVKTDPQTVPKAKPATITNGVPKPIKNTHEIEKKK